MNALDQPPRVIERPTSVPWLVGVVIPARDEASTVADCLEAIIDSLNFCPDISSSWITLVADSCKDDTAAIARAVLRGRGQVIECSVASAGTARRLGAESILSHLCCSRASSTALAVTGSACHLSASPTNCTWLANTDADSMPSHDWLRQQLDLANRGYCGVAGIVRLRDTERPDIIRSHLDDYVLHPDGTHPHVHGANFGLRADAYLDVGGWNDLALAEDHCLWKRLAAKQWKTVASIASVVTTSARLQGRAQGGFADSLRQKVGSICA